MKNLFKARIASLLGIIALAAVIVFSFSGCATNVATNKGTNFDRRTLGLIGVPKYTVLGAVTMEKAWFGILGFSFPSFHLPLNVVLPGGDFYIYQSGGVTYVNLLEEAKKKYPDADAVIDISTDYSETRYFVFYGKRTNIVSGIAIKYSRDEVDYPPQNEVYVLGERKG